MNVQQLKEELKNVGGESYSTKGRRNPIRDDTGAALSSIVALAPKGAVLELGTAYGLSMCWLYAGDPRRRFYTVEFDKRTAQQAQSNFTRAGMNVTVWAADAGQVAKNWQWGKIGVLFLDHEKRLYLPHYELVKKHLIRGAIVIADNVLDRSEECAPFMAQIKKDAKKATVIQTECGLLVAKL